PHTSTFLRGVDRLCHVPLHSNYDHRAGTRDTHAGCRDKSSPAHILGIDSPLTSSVRSNNHRGCRLLDSVPELVSDYVRVREVECSDAAAWPARASGHHPGAGTGALSSSAAQNENSLRHARALTCHEMDARRPVAQIHPLLCVSTATSVNPARLRRSSCSAV